MSKGRGWWGESGRHSQAARGHKTTGKNFHQDPFTPTMSIDGHMVVTLLERPTGVSVRWVKTLGDAKVADHSFLFPNGIPDTDYAVLEEDDKYVFLAALLHSGHASDKHRYLVTKRDWEKAIKKSGGKFF